MIDGVLTAIGLSVLGLQFGFLIGLFLAIAGLIPWVGFAICYIPAVIFGFLQIKHLPPPPLGTGFFFFFQQIDRVVGGPQILRDLVGPHSDALNLSVFFLVLVL